MIYTWRDAANAFAGIALGYSITTDHIVLAWLIGVILIPWGRIGSFTWETMLQLVDWKTNKDFNKILKG